MYRPLPWVRHAMFMIVIVLAATMTVANSYAYEQELSRIAQDLADVIGDTGKKNVATVDFTDLQGNITELGRFIAEELSTSLVMAEKGFSVVDRTHLRTILAEQKLSVTGLLDPRNAQKIGQIAGVDALILGNIVPLGETVRLSIKIVATDTAKVIGASRGSIALTGAIRTMLDTAIARQYITGNTQGSEGDVSVPAIGSVNAAAASFRNGFISVNVTGLNASQDGQSVKLSLRLENITDKSIEVVMISDGKTPKAVLLDNMGISWLRKSPAIGVESLMSNYVKKGYANRMTPLNPGQSIPVVLEFQPQEASKGTRFDFNAQMGGVVEGKGIKYTVTLSGLRIP